MENKKNKPDLTGISTLSHNPLATYAVHGGNKTVKVGKKKPAKK